MIITALLNHMKKTEETILSQSRMIENIEEFNQSLVQEEEKVRHANDELAKQKNELMAAKHQTEKMNTEMLIQNEIVKYISSSLEIDRLMAMIADSLIGALGANIAAIVLYPGATDNNESKSNIRTTNSQEFQTLFSNYVLAGCLNQYIQNNRTFVDNEVDEARYDFLQNSKVGSMVIIPLIKGEARIGALCVGHPNHDYFDENTQLRFFESIVAQFLIALENANLYMRMEKLATKDGLTGVYNRGYLTKLLKEALNDAVLNQTSISLALFDIDHFKLVNDTYGHLTGDEVIKVLAGIAMEIAAKNFGLVGRFGGEEFVILFPEKTIDQSIKPVEKLRSLLKEASVEHNGKKVNITISVGLTCYPETCSNPQELLNHADWAMYYSKQNGRDQITIDNDTVQKLVKMQ
ncbi:diguanylate cyclase with PAS/PAC sensor [Lachnospiraceae bacterium KM106-2]|nr:diguanylate cyclase with PAS/PAC sensor [Lachnospiraceae bacterium KM106-2]